MLKRLPNSKHRNCKLAVHKILTGQHLNSCIDPYQHCCRNLTVTITTTNAAHIYFYLHGTTALCNNLRLLSFKKKIQNCNAKLRG